MDTGKIVVGALVGVAVGMALGILFAPDKGSNLRKKAVLKSSDYIDNMKVKYNSVIDSLTSKLDHASNDGSSLDDKAWEAAENSRSPLSHS